MSTLPESQLWGWESFFYEITKFLRESGRQFGSCSENYANYAVERLEICIVNVSHLKDHLENGVSLVQPEDRDIVTGYKNNMDDLVMNLRSLSEEWHRYIATTERISESLRYRVVTGDNVARGRPPFIISKEQLEYLRSISFSWTDIAMLLGVSRMTLFRRRQEYGLLDEPDRLLTDSELAAKVSEIKNMLPDAGEKLILGQLKAMGYSVTRNRVRNTLRSVDPINTALRWQGGITIRRPYSVPGPNSLWHIGMFRSYVSVCYDMLVIEFIFLKHHRL